MNAEQADKPKIASSEVFDLAGMIDYGQAAVVSRTLMENAAGTVTLFAFDADQGLSEHTTPFDAMVQVIDGQGEFVIGGKTFQVSAGRIIVMPANVPHAVRAVERFKMLLTMLRK